DHLAVAVDSDALGDQVFLDHLLERVALDVLRVAARAQAFRREIGRAAELGDALGDLVGVLLLLVGVLQELRRHALGMDALRHVVMELVAQRADDLGGERLVEELQHHAAVGVVTGSHRPLGDVLPGTPTQRLDVGEKGSPAGLGCGHRALPGGRRAGAGGAVTLRVGLGVLRLDVGLLFVLLRFRLLLAVVHAVLVRLALLLGHFVLAFGLGLVDLAGVAVGRLVLLLELGLGDLLVRLGFGLANVLLVAFHAAALRLGGLRIGFDLVLL